jgi:transposase-like protein
VALAETGLHAG